DRDGAPDPVRVHPWTAAGNAGVEIAQAIYAFAGNCTPLVTAPLATGAALVMADADGDARPDLWEIDASGERVMVTIHTHASGYSQRLRPRETGNPAGEGAVFLAGDHDRDGFGDLFVIASGRLQVWAGPQFDALLVQADLPAEAGEGWRFALGDQDLDGIPDLFALSPDAPARLLVLGGAGGFTAAVVDVITAATGHDGTFAVGDLDGDGRSDLYFLDPDGSLTVYLGGERGDTPVEDLTRWFVEGTDQPTTRQEACPVVP
ncbi:MAG: VCBS repeat-containing protein, partial [Gemmatimonadetes bacterium]|nr:VCBS repeat-containing protein [Gemmatimonadota bacterium]